MNRILALDLGTKTGFALNLNDEINSGVQDFSPRRWDGGGMRFLRFKRWLEEIHLSTFFKEIYYEEVRRHRGTDAAHIYGGLQGILTSWCEERNVPYEAIPVGTIKKAATGKGNCNKQAMIDAAIAKGWNPRDDNEADALHLLDYVLNAQNDTKVP